VGEIEPRGTGGAVYQTQDGGRSWRPIARTSEILTAVQFVTPQTGWVAGHAGRIARTDDGGLSWKAQRIEREGEVLNAIFFIDPQRGWAVGGSGLVLRTTNGGESWEQVVTGRIEDLWAVRFASPERGWIVGEDGLILSTTDGGKHWAAQASGTSHALLGVAVAPSTVVIAVGEAGTIVRSTTDSDWSAVDCATTATLNAVVVSDQLFCAVGANGATLESTDQGRSWATAAVASRDLYAIALADAAHGIAVGQRGITQFLQGQ
jgi:photosystem II stability/assembly factor-like uncharacterized protein